MCWSDSDYAPGTEHYGALYRNSVAVCDGARHSKVKAFTFFGAMPVEYLASIILSIEQ